MNKQQTMMNTSRAALVALVAFATLGIAARAEGTLPSKPVLTLDAAKQVARVAVSYAQANKAPGAAIAIVDDGGTPVYLERLDGTFPMSSVISIGKARTAALFKKPTKFFEEAINKGRTAMTTLNDFTPLQGGVPLIVNGSIVGAIGVSGAASADQDVAIAEAAAQAASTLFTATAP